MKIYRALLRLYPASFRADYAPELERTFHERHRDRGSVAALLAAITDVVPNAIAQHWAILMQDLRFTARSLNSTRGFAVAAVLVTALGVGANTATFSVADFVLVRALPYPNPEELVRLCEGPVRGGGWGCNQQLSPANYRDMVAMSSSFKGWGAWAASPVNLVGNGDPARLSGVSVTSGLLSILGVRPMVGRTFDTTSTGAGDATSVVISYGLWQTRYGSDPGIVGTSMSLDGAPYAVIGVMPPTFRFPNEDVALWMPMVLREDDYADRNNSYIEAIGRLKDGVTFEQGRAELQQVAARLARDFPETNGETGVSFFRQRDEMSPRYRIMLLSLVGASLCMLLLTCANLANLLLARAAGRERELAVRAALGAGRERLVRQLLTESVLLALIGGLAGALTAFLVMPFLALFIPPTLPIAGEPRVDLRVLAIAAAISGLTGLGFGLIPALRAGGVAGFEALREGGRGGGGRRQRLRSLLVAGEVLVSVVLLISTGLLIRAVWQVQAVDPGFAPGEVMTLRTELTNPQYQDRARRSEFYRGVLESVRALPGVEKAAFTSGLPMVLTGGIAVITVPGEVARPSARTSSMRYVSPQYFETLKIPVRRGRDVADTDTPDAPLVAVVSESFVQEFRPVGDALGMQFDIRGQTRMVVGVVGDIRVRGLERNSEPQVYLPAAQPPEELGSTYVPKDLVVRSSQTPASLLPGIREIVHRVDADQPISNVRMLADVVGDQTAERRTQAGVLGALAVVALLLTGVGIHGLLAFMVAQRSREIGVRLALGARPSIVARMVVLDAVKMALLGLVPGVLTAYGVARAMSALLFGVQPGDPATIGAGVVLILLVTLAGSLAPVFKAVRVSPQVAMRAE